ncbi:amidase [Pseudalkalibacillus salsuginis]|uniref:amidase n=1 Tax=Pseudalkalibacillus salsuginis TaxID=2910972 RepID=UPI001F3D022C|nr:amidase [Pseudalkalibacillus salsuginis]MCF6409340.1 amidase [Pseudalkalibacillus salsuginis]
MTILDMDASEIAARIKEGKITSELAVETYIKHIEAINPKLNCMTEDRFDASRKEARQSDVLLKEGHANGKLFGVPVSIKESFNVEGMKTTGGLVHRKDFVAKDDAEVVRLLKKEGAIVLGKTNTPSLCFYQETENPVYGRTNNPWDLEATAGGSSGGEGSLMGAGGAAVGLGADIGGSIRFPCHFNGVVGFKSGNDQVSQEGNYPYVEFEEQKRMLGIGAMGKSVRDTRLINSIISIKQPITVDLSSFELVVPQFYSCPLGVQTGRLVRTIKEDFEQDFSIQLDEPPFFNESSLIWQQLMSLDGAKALRKHLMVNDKQPSVYVEFLKSKYSRSDIHTFLSWAMIGARLFRPSGKRLKTLREILRKGDDRLQTYLDHRLIVIPVYHSPAPPHGQLYKELFSFSKTFLRYMPYIAYGNTWGLPSLTVPVGETSKGLPISVQVMSRVGNEAALFEFGELLENKYRGYRRCDQHDVIKKEQETAI